MIRHTIFTCRTRKWVKEIPQIHIERTEPYPQTLYLLATTQNRIATAWRTHHASQQCIFHKHSISLKKYKNVDCLPWSHLYSCLWRHFEVLLRSCVSFDDWTCPITERERERETDGCSIFIVCRWRPVLFSCYFPSISVIKKRLRFVSRLCCACVIDCFLCESFNVALRLAVGLLFPSPRRPASLSGPRSLLSAASAPHLYSHTHTHTWLLWCIRRPTLPTLSHTHTLSLVAGLVSYQSLMSRRT